MSNDNRNQKPNQPNQPNRDTGKKTGEIPGQNDRKEGKDESHSQKSQK
ncbi:hypothetical protein ABIE56_000944 [Luteibacter sp. 621]